MRTSAKYLIGSLAFGLFASEALATSGPGWVRQAWTAPLAAIQLPSGGAFQGGSHPDRVEAEKWLRNARSAMNEGKFDVADYSIRKAEEHASRIPATEVPLAYTPQMAREELIARSTPMPAPAAPTMNNDPNVVARPYQPATDPTRNMPASTTSPFNGSLGQEPATLPMPVGAEAVDAQQDLLRQKLTQEVFRERAVAERMVAQKDPRGGLEHLRQLRTRLDQAEIDPQARRQLILVVDREIADLEAFIQRNLADIENAELNAQRMNDVQQMQARKIEVEQRLAQLVEEFNKLMDEYRWAEAEVIARQAMELAPTEPVVQNMIWKSKYARNLHQQMAIRDQKQDGVVAALTNTEEASIPFDDNDPYRFPEIDDWRQISRRAGMGRDRQQTAEEIRISNTLKTQKIDLRFDNTPLAEALDILGAQAGINFHLDRAAMMNEAVTSDTPVSINLPQPIVLESGLTLLLDNLNLTYEVRDDVVRITTPEAKSRVAAPRTYYVGDLVMPIPNFIPTYNMGLGGALANAYQNLGMGMNGMPGLGSPMSPLSFAGNQGGGSIASQALAQNLPAGAMPQNSSANPTLFGGGPGGMGGGIMADFDPLMELIQRTIAPESWEELGGTGRMQEFTANLSLVIYQSQDVHEQIQDLLDQLRRLQDLQITIEVRFITLQDDFFERIGVDFDFDVRDNNRFARDEDGNPILPQDGQPGGIIGLGPDGNPTPDFDLAFDQGNFGSAVPTFGGFDPNTAANFGFAILSDIEVFMLLQAAKGDTRTNILQAPKVTLFNGQTALVNDTSQRPFVTGIVPVVGDFAAAQMPVVVVLSEGTQLSVNAVATDDRRFVRLTLVPFFSQIGDVEEFTFEGTETTTTGTTVPDPTDPTRPIRNGASTTRTGSTVQLPTFASTSINTTVSVPDGGTVLLGGIKRLREGRNERGVPMLSNLPFVNRLFKNVGIGREAQSLMMMVTPRIIIQEEEEANQVGAPSP